MIIGNLAWRRLSWGWCPTCLSMQNLLQNYIKLLKALSSWVFIISQNCRTSALPAPVLTILLVRFCPLPHIQSSSTSDVLSLSNANVNVVQCCSLFLHGPLYQVLDFQKSSCHAFYGFLCWESGICSSFPQWKQESWPHASSLLRIRFVVLTEAFPP